LNGFSIIVQDHRPSAGARAMLPMNMEVRATALIDATTNVERNFSVVLVVFMVISFAIVD
jgi:hypothetical protein